MIEIEVDGLEQVIKLLELIPEGEGGVVFVPTVATIGLAGQPLAPEAFTV